MRWSNIANPIPDLPPLRAVIARYNLRADKKFGQNFILDMNITRRIARAAGDLHKSEIVEIGPGPGGLTRALLMEGAHHIHAIEADTRFRPALQEIAAAYPNRLTLHFADARQLPPQSIARAPYRIVANLPYNVATPLIVDWLKSPSWQSLTLTLQKEVAARITAKPATPAYGRLAILAAVQADARILFDLPPSVFVPPPKVTSAVVQLTPRAAPRANVDLAQLESITAICFGQRRKMLRSSLKSLCSNPSALCARLGLDETARAETLTVEDFCALANILGGAENE